MLKRKIAQLNPFLSVWELDGEMPCCHFTDGGRCGESTMFAVVYERGASVEEKRADAVFVVFPYCQHHLPSASSSGGDSKSTT